MIQCIVMIGVYSLRMQAWDGNTGSFLTRGQKVESFRGEQAAKFWLKPIWRDRFISLSKV